MTRKHDVNFNIVYGSVQELQGKLFGNLLVSFAGDEQAVKQTLEELKTLVKIGEVTDIES
ncbi:Methionine import ATP-binding protein MetN [Lentibacillus sp. JNUCC-1]|nr:Methionine import ATP-binding protein MetN [Lentibacillus sp. JNUCC-1]